LVGTEKGEIAEKAKQTSSSA